ncbi:MAG TPA: alpha/beta fold hydrolase [Actinomycetota bacterium]|nr:alpha/beta fold hydrolase [Actinomycetota bacterium]
MNAPVVPGAEGFAFEGGPSGVLLLHGFTGNPSSLRPMGEWLNQRGHSIACPRYPGHGTLWRELGKTRWQQWVAEADAALGDLLGRCRSVIAFGLSVGGAMALHLAARYPHELQAVAVCNGFVRDRRILVAPYLWPVIPPRKGIGNDISKAAQNELPYERIPARAIAELAKFLRLVRKELPTVRQPLVVFNSSQDHVVPKGTARWLMARVASEMKELIDLPKSYHVATLDHDAEIIYRRTHELAEAALTTPRPR